MKKIISVLLCAVLAFSGTICANAAGKPAEHKGFTDLSIKTEIPDNTVKVYAYGVDSTHTNGILYVGGDTEKEYEALFKNSVSSPQVLKMPSTEKYARYFSSGSGNIYAYHTFETTGGTYKKIKIKLSEFSDYFNEDGSHDQTVDHSTGESHNYKFKYEDMGKGFYYNSALAFISGGAVTGVTPDENGEAEIFVCTDVGENIEMITTFSHKRITPQNTLQTGGGGGFTGGTFCQKLTFGNVDGIAGVDVNDVTYLQMYLAGMVDLDTLQLFHADSNCDDEIDVSDVTHLQFGLAER